MENTTQPVVFDVQRKKIRSLVLIYFSQGLNEAGIEICWLIPAVSMRLDNTPLQCDIWGIQCAISTFHIALPFADLVARRMAHYAMHMLRHVLCVGVCILLRIRNAFIMRTKHVWRIVCTCIVVCSRWNTNEPSYPLGAFVDNKSDATFGRHIRH